MESTKPINIRNSLINLGRVSYDPSENKLKVGHPLYDINLIDRRSQVWEEYVTKRLAKDAKSPYKNELKP